MAMEKEDFVVKLFRFAFAPYVKSLVVSGFCLFGYICFVWHVLHLFLPTLFGLLCLSAIHVHSMTTWGNVVDLTLDVGRTMWKHLFLHGSSIALLNVPSHDTESRYLLHTPQFPKDSYVLDFVADVGDGFASSSVVAKALVSKILHVKNETMPRGDYVIFGGDLSYPQFSEPHASRRFVEVYENAWQNDGPEVDIKLEEVPWSFFVVGNHDFLDDCATFNKLIEHHHFGRWRIGNRHRTGHFLLILHSWCFIGLTFSPSNDLIVSEVEDVIAATERFLKQHKTAALNFVIVAHRPFWLFLQTPPNIDVSPQLHRFLTHVKCCGRIRMFLAGDLHNFSHFKVVEESGWLNKTEEQQQQRLHRSNDEIIRDYQEQRDQQDDENDRRWRAKSLQDEELEHRKPALHPDPSYGIREQVERRRPAQEISDVHYLVSGGGGAFLHPSCRKHFSSNASLQFCFPNSNLKFRLMLLYLPFLQPFLWGIATFLFYMNVPYYCLSCVHWAARSLWEMFLSFNILQAVFMVVILVYAFIVSIMRLPKKSIGYYKPFQDSCLCFLFCGFSFLFGALLFSLVMNHVNETIVTIVTLIMVYSVFSIVLLVGWTIILSIGLGVLSVVVVYRFPQYLQIAFNLAFHHAPIIIIVFLFAIILGGLFVWFWMVPLCRNFADWVKNMLIQLWSLLYAFALFLFNIALSLTEDPRRHFVARVWPELKKNFFLIFAALVTIIIGAFAFIYGHDKCGEVDIWLRNIIIFESASDWNKFCMEFSFLLGKSWLWLSLFGALYAVLVSMFEKCCGRISNDLGCTIDEGVFSLLKLADAKNFLRMRVSKEKLEVFVLAIDDIDDGEWAVVNRITIVS